jgi:hypothetical protein
MTGTVPKAQKSFRDPKFRTQLHNKHHPTPTSTRGEGKLAIGDGLLWKLSPGADEAGGLLRELLDDVDEVPTCPHRSVAIVAGEESERGRRREKFRWQEMTNLEGPKLFLLLGLPGQVQVRRSCELKGQFRQW